jgi:hypothetical protein
MKIRLSGDAGGALPVDPGKRGHAGWRANRAAGASIRRLDSEACGPDTCCIDRCCFNSALGVCGIQTRCADGDCCPVGFSCCDATDGTRNSTCYNGQTCKTGQALCCGSGNTCCVGEDCCTSDAQCKDGKRCLSDSGNPSTAGCCKF